jgi:hypothetical protein
MLYTCTKEGKTTVAEGDGWTLSQDSATLRITAKSPEGKEYRLVNIKESLSSRNMNVIFMCLERDIINKGRPYPVMRNSRNYALLTALFLGEEARKAGKAERRVHR